MLQVFNQFLSAKERIPEKNIPYYVKWVSDCYRYFDIPETQPLTNDQNAKFLNHLAKKHEDWQVQQADRALRLYGYFLSRRQRNEDGASGDMPDDWKKIEEKMREALRLRHRSYSTEKTYVMWLRQFQGFVNGRQPQSLDGKNIQDFLSYLAVEKRFPLQLRIRRSMLLFFSTGMCLIKILQVKSAL